MAHVVVNGNLPSAARLHPGAGRMQTLPETVVTATRLPKHNPDRFATTILKYPLNVGSESQGHYITFHIRTVDPAQLKAFKEHQASLMAKLENAVATELNARAQVGAAGIGRGRRSEAQIRTYWVEKLGIDNWTGAPSQTSGNTGSGIKSNSIRLMGNTTKRLTGTISLYMPPSVQVSYESKYGDQEIGLLAEGGYAAIKAFMSPGGMDKTAAMNALNTVELGAKQAILKTLDVVAPGATALFAIDRGKIITPKMELMFEGIGRRNFSFSFVFIPKGPEEAQEIHNIVYQFKYHMAANYEGGGANGLREMSFPDLFDIEYMHIGEENSNLNKIATCALTKMDVEYGGDRYVAYEGGVPQTTKLSLNFTEMEIITKEHIADGY